MPDREKVITGLELCAHISQDGCLMLCPYKDEPTELCEEVLKHDALELLKEQQPKWIPVEERLPEENKDVLVWVNGTYRDMAYRDEGRWYDEIHNILQHITHWMPLPEPPKDGE